MSIEEQIPVAAMRAIDEHEHILEAVKSLNEAPVPTENRYWVDENGNIQSNITQ
jgi:hypothetical protein